MPFEKNNTYGKNNKRGLGKNKEAIKDYLEKICNELIKEMDLMVLQATTYFFQAHLALKMLLNMVTF